MEIHDDSVVHTRTKRIYVYAQHGVKDIIIIIIIIAQRTQIFFFISIIQFCISNTRRGIIFDSLRPNNSTIRGNTMHQPTRETVG